MVGAGAGVHPAAQSCTLMAAVLAPAPYKSLSNVSYFAKANKANQGLLTGNMRERMFHPHDLVDGRRSGDNQHPCVVVVTISIPCMQQI